MKDVDELVKLAQSQGFGVAVNGAGHIKFVSPTDGSIIVTCGSNTYGRTLTNVKTKLRRAGLDVPLASPKKKDHDMTEKLIETPATGPERKAAAVAELNDLLRIQDALDASIQMVEELADQFAQYRKHTQGELAELRGLVQAAGRKADAAMAKATEGVSAEQLVTAVKELRGHIDAAAARAEQAAEKADPIAAFRARLNR